MCKFKLETFRVAVIFLFLLLAGCGEEKVVSELDQKQANEIVAALSSKGIVAYSRTERSGAGHSRFYVEVNQDDYGLAVTVLQELGLPRDGQPTFRELTEQKGFLPNSREIESARLDYAFGLEIEEKLKAVSGIEDVKVAVRSNILKSDQEPSASVIISTQQGVEIDPKQISQVVGLMVPGLNSARIAVMIEPVSTPLITISNSGSENNQGVVIYRPLVSFLKYFKIPDGDVRPLASLILGLILLAGLVCFVAGYAYGGKTSAQKMSQSMSSGMQLSKLTTDKGSGRIRIDSSYIKSIDE
ncbi:MAG: hypothetical protein SGJ02_03445 [bacterium]|nr:hypothetical protein [bacterium]